MSNAPKKFFIAIQATYSDLSIALFNDQNCCQVRSNNQLRASSHIIPEIKTLLEIYGIGFNDLKFIAIDQGPGAFTSLRVGIATLNGLAFGNKMPLVGINGLDALAHQILKDSQPNADIIACLLNAYNDDIYYGLYNHQGQKLDQGCQKIDLLIEQLNQKNILFVGNGAMLHKDLLNKTFNEKATFVDVPVCSAQTIGELALQEWQKQHVPTFRLEPLYLKTQLFAVRKPA